MAARNSQQVVEVVAQPTTVAVRVSQVVVEVIINTAEAESLATAATQGGLGLRMGLGL